MSVNVLKYRMINRGKVFLDQLCFTGTSLFVTDRIIKYAEKVSTNEKFKQAVTSPFPINRCVLEIDKKQKNHPTYCKRGCAQPGLLSNIFVENLRRIGSIGGNPLKSTTNPKKYNQEHLSRMLR